MDNFRFKSILTSVFKNIVRTFRNSLDIDANVNKC
jgi:hypothetical protein